MLRGLLLVFFVLMGGLFVVHGQTANRFTTNTVVPVIEDDMHEVVDSFDGTFQFIFYNGKKQVFTDGIINTINANRRQDEEVTLVLSPFCKLRILPISKISAPDFVPFTRSYVFENQ